MIISHRHILRSTHKTSSVARAIVRTFRCRLHVPDEDSREIVDTGSARCRDPPCHPSRSPEKRTDATGWRARISRAIGRSRHRSVATIVLLASIRLRASCCNSRAGVMAIRPLHETTRKTQPTKRSTMTKSSTMKRTICFRDHRRGTSNAADTQLIGTR